MNRAQIRVLEETDEVRLGGLLERGDGAALEPEVGLEVLRDLADEALERELTDQKLRALLVLPDFSQRHRSWTESVRLLHSSGRRSGLPGSLCCQLLPRRLAAGGLASGLLCTSHEGSRRRAKENVAFGSRESEGNLLQVVMVSEGNLGDCYIGEDLGMVKAGTVKFFWGKVR